MEKMKGRSSSNFDERADKRDRVRTASRWILSLFYLIAGVAHLGITVNAVDPGATDTGWMDNTHRAAIERESPRGRIGQPQDAARLIAFLASDEAEWITGQIIRSRGWL